MTRINMVWTTPTVAGMLAIYAAGSLYGVANAQEAAPVPDQTVELKTLRPGTGQAEPAGDSAAASKWNFSAESDEPPADDVEPTVETTAAADEAVLGSSDGEDAPAPEDEGVGDAASMTQEQAEQAEEAESAAALSKAETAQKRLAAITRAAADNEGETSTDNDDQDNDDQSEESRGQISATQAAALERRQQRSSLDQQYAKLRKTLETADAYSEELGEDYFGYGMLLRENGQFEEAIDAFVDALHINKINNGIYAPEQRASLKALFETHYALGNVEDFEDYLQRILWIEEKNPDLNDEFSFHMLVMVGNQYIDQFLRKPVAQQKSVETLLRAKSHFNAAVRHHAHKPLDVVLMPYGELALISFLENQLLPNVDQTASMEDARLRRSRNLDGRELALFSYLNNSFPRGHALLRSYLVKAQKEEDQEHMINALIALGDFNQLFKRHSTATDLYRAAWKASRPLLAPSEISDGEITDPMLALAGAEPLDVSFAEPVPLPDFSYSREREDIIPDRPTTLVPLKLTISAAGTVQDVQRGDIAEENERYYARAKRTARRLVFRPKIVDGEPVETLDVDYQARVYARK